MPTLTMYGASDDLIEAEGIPGCDEFTADYNPDSLTMGSFVVGGKMRILAAYDGCWMFAIGQVDEDVPLPDWPISISQHTDISYSTMITIEVPEGTTLVREATK